MSGETLGQSMLENLHKISLTSIEKAPVTQPNIYSLDSYKPQEQLLSKIYYDRK